MEHETPKTTWFKGGYRVNRYSKGKEEWLNQKGWLHRTDGPARIWPEINDISWWYEGQRFNFLQWCRMANKTEEEIVMLKLKYELSNDIIKDDRRTSNNK